MRMHHKTMAFWAFYALFAAYALFANWHDTLFQFSGPLGVVKLLVWLLLAGFLVYSVHCSMHENLFRTIGVMAKLYWGRQIGMDLYLGLFIATLLVYLHAGPIAVLIWIVPILIFANLITLLYLAIHFDSIVARFIGS